jgi:hypothetical protein
MSLDIAVKNSASVLDAFVARGIEIEVTHRSKRRLFGLKRLAPLREDAMPLAACTAPRRSGRLAGRPAADAAYADGLVAPPLTQIQTIDQMMAQHRDRPRPASDIPIEIQTKLVHESLDRQYRALLDQPVPMLGDVTPRSAARTAGGREKLAVWLKHLENRSRQQPDPANPVATYDFARLWRELKVEKLRQ